MLHKLLTGGDAWKYEPFAQARLKAMRATGLKHASQKFMVEGYLISVKIVGDQEFIRIEGGGCTFKMDSGLINSEYFNWSSTVFFPQNYTTGSYLDTVRTLAYNAAFTKPNTNPPASLNPGSGSAGQFSGDVTKTTEFKGLLLADTTPRSFSPGKEKKLFGSEELIVDIEFDENLKRKKLTVNACPASTFTGRTRLYVQAMYGTHVYKKFAPDALPTQFFFLSDKTFQYQPVLFVTALARNDKNEAGVTIVYPAVDINTSTGVYLDKSTGNHWLFNISDNEWLVYPLIADACGEQARKYLKSDSDLSAEDQHHLEAYILSTCRPDSKKVQSAAFGGRITPGSTMGYGWHWNYSGTVCDIAVTRTVPGSEVGEGRINKLLESTHFSIAVSKTDTGSIGSDDFKHQWKASLSTVSGPSRWCTNRGLWGIAHPVGADLMEKLVPDAASSESGVTMYPGTGTFYVYYKGDERKICSVGVVAVEAISGNWQNYSSSGSEIYQTAGYISINIRGPDGSGYIATEPDTNAHFVVTHTIAGDAIGPHYSLKIGSGGIHRSVNGGGLGDYIPSIYTAAGVSSPYPILEGPPLGPPEYAYHNIIWTDLNAYRYGGGHNGLATSTTSAYGKSEWGRAVIIVPQGDSEAIFATDDRFLQTRDTGSITVAMTNVPGDSEFIPILNGVEGTPIYHTGWWDAEAILRTSMPTGTDVVTVDTHLVSTRKLYCIAGSIDALAGFDDVMGYVTGDVHEDLIPFTIKVVSGTKPDSPVLSKTMIDPQGTTNDPTYPVLVGWV